MAEPGQSLARFLILTLSLLAGACSVPHEGLFPGYPVAGDRYELFCDIEFNYRTDSAPDFNIVSRSMEVCSNGAPRADARRDWCGVLAEATIEELDDDYGEVYYFNARSSYAPRALPESCVISELTPPGDIGSRVDMLSSAISPGGHHLFQDESGSIVGNMSTSSLRGTSVHSDVQVWVKFLSWRSARTNATGRVAFDGGDCIQRAGCELVLRDLDLDVADFTIVRPTALARDVSIRNARIYVVKDYVTTVGADGRFAFNDIRLMVSAEQNGQQQNFLAESTASLQGQLGNFLSGNQAAAQTVTLQINGRDARYALRANMTFELTQLRSRMQNRATGRCLRGEFGHGVSRATIESCYQGTQPQNITIERRGNIMRFRNAATDQCLNLKSSRQNREGGAVEWVGCSSHADQKWRVYSNGKLVHDVTEKCLNVHRGRENRDGGKVSVYSCANTPDQRWDFINMRR